MTTDAILGCWAILVLCACFLVYALKGLPHDN